MTKLQTICLAGVGDLGRYLLEEISSDERYNVAVLTRQVERAISQARLIYITL